MTADAQAVVKQGPVMVVYQGLGRAHTLYLDQKRDLAASLNELSSVRDGETKSR